MKRLFVILITFFLCLNLSAIEHSDLSGTEGKVEYLSETESVEEFFELCDDFTDVWEVFAYDNNLKFKRLDKIPRTVKLDVMRAVKTNYDIENNELYYIMFSPYKGNNKIIYIAYVMIIDIVEDMHAMTVYEFRER